MKRIFVIILTLFFNVTNAQVTDSFTDGDYTVNPIWTPSAPTDFTVAAGQLKSANTTTNASFYISTTNTLAANCVWEFWLNLQFATSGANYVDAYLTADNSNLLSPTLNGYFVRIGHTSDDISLYKNTAGVQTILIDGINTSVASSTNNLIKIKVTRSSANLFTLERDMTGTGTSYVSEGNITDASFSTSASFGFLIKQSTATFFAKHLFDDISITPIIADVTAPTLVSATAVSSTAIDVLFNENVDLTTSQTVTNYTINTGIGNPTLATRDGSNLSLVHLTLGTTMTNGTYTIDINAVQDLAGNAISTSTISFNYFVAATPNFKDIVINEIYADPTPIINLTATEFIELYNQSASPFNLNGLKFTDNTSTATLGNYTLAPNSYVIICPIADTAQFTALGYMNKLGVSSFPSLNNTGDNLYLKNASNTVLDSVNYSDTWYQDATKKLGGYTLEQINPSQNVACSQANNWIASNDVDGGTPGFVNSVYSALPDVTGPGIASLTVIDASNITVCFNDVISVSQLTNTVNYSVNNAIGSPTLAIAGSGNMCATLSLPANLINNTTYTLTVSGIADCNGNAIATPTISFTYSVAVAPGFKDIVINEIMAAPHTTLNAYRMEYIELYNKSVNPIDLSGLKLADTYTGSGATLGSYILQPNSYVAVCTTNSATALSAASGNTNVIGVASFPSLTNAGDNIYLKSGSTLIDSVNYLDSWYQNSTKKAGGWSLELINPNQNISCSQANNWIASNDVNGGTPGFVNSVYSVIPDITGPGFTSVTVIDASNITVCFNDAISVSQLTNTVNYSVNNSVGSPTLAVNSSGNMCATLSLGTTLINNATYTLTVSGITDCNGNAIATPTISFTYVIFDTPVYNDVIINEILVDVSPAPVSVPAKQYLELYNKSLKIFNLNNWLISDGQTNTTITSNYVLYPNSYVVITKSSDTASFTGITNKIGTSTFPTFNISGDPVFLSDNFSTTIDSIRYNTSWYRNTVKDDGGWSLELINPTQNATCLAVNNWIASTNLNGGTPGIINSVYSITPDLTGPSISDISVIDSLHVLVCFNDIISASQLNTATNYVVNGIIGTPTLALASTGNMCTVLSLTTKLSNAANYTLTVSGITDCNGNNLTPNTGTFSYYKHKIYDVVFNELMPDPPTTVDIDNLGLNIPAEEYVELKNRTAFSINLKGWTFSTPTTTKILPSITIKPDSFVVLTATGNANAFYNYGIVAYEVTSFPALLNSGTTLTLRDTNGIVINTITYETSWYNDANKDGGGWSLEQIDPNNPCGGQSNWHASYSVNRGTPGRRNSVLASNPDNTAPQLERIAVASADTIILVFTEPLDSLSLTNPAIYSFDNGLLQPTYILPLAPDYRKVKLKLSSPMQVGIIYNCTVLTGIKDCVGNLVPSGSSAPFALPQAPIANDVVINEILFDPNLGGIDFVEIYNRSNKTIDLSDLRIGSMDTITGILTSTEVITTEGYLLFPETYLVISESGATVKQQYLTINPKGFLDIPTLPSMNTTDDVVTLSNATGGVIDNFKYTSKMHFPLLVSTKGVSLERIDFNRPTNDRTNWNSAAEAVGFATPAYRNSQYLQADGGSGVSVSNPLFSPDNDGYNDVLNISYKLDEPGKAANVYIYDSRGRQVRYLIRNEQLPQDGTLSWNGINDDNEKAPIGIYVIYVELFNLSGKVNKYKLSCTLAGKL